MKYKKIVTKKYKYGGKKKVGIKKLTRKVNFLSRELKPELKYLDLTTSLAIQPTWSGSIITICNNISQGLLDVGNRVGDKIRLKNFYLCQNWNGNYLSSQTWQQVRVIVFRGKNENQLLPLPSQIVSAVGNNYTPMAKYSFDQRSTFTVLADRMFTVPAGTSIATNTKINHTVKINVPINHICKYFGSGTNVIDGGIYILMFTSEAANPPYMTNSYVRLTYTDV